MKSCALLTTLMVMIVGCGSSSATEDNTAQLDLGRQIYATNCAACHGARGEGDGQDWTQPDANGVYPPPPHNDSGHTWHHTDGQLYNIVANGGALPNSGMPPYGSILSHDEIIATLEYIKTFWSPDNRAAQANVSRDMPYPIPPRE